tara:strand:- start:14994 stop:16136 length:1143 start_codon:yes stop_codon:yes gene_type:complete
MNLSRLFTFLFTSVATGLAAAFILVVIRPDLLGFKADQRNDTIPVNQPSYAAAVQLAAPSVVNVFATRLKRERSGSIFKDPIFQRFFGEQFTKPQLKRENSLGSGVIVSNEGFILTNNHVISGADEIQIVLKDGRQLNAKIIGTDPESDLAVLKANGENLPIASFGDSQRIQVGDIVMAIGNPFGVGQTVTMGIVSATGRNQLGITNFENFIQTDAAINPGNSGGALINTKGEVIGISTAIFSDSGGSHGIGFAIPMELAQVVMREIVQYRRVIRGWIGISAQNMTEELAQSLNTKNEGLLISGVLEGGPADRAGLLPGDIILEVNKEKAENYLQILNRIAQKKPGEKVNIKVKRIGKLSKVIQEFNVEAIVTERPTGKD